MAGGAPAKSVTSPDLDAIVAADHAAAREIDAVTAQLAARLQSERERLNQERAARAQAAQARVDDALQAIEHEGEARVRMRRANRAADREARRAHAAAAVAPAVAAYVAIVGGSGESTS
ncbi:MAG TPA: hypothetical protein VH442_07275 [Micromonosporaceae bacterium]